ncbi:MAG: TetR family transcriptional regulator [Ktedonobacteraceae bacterium]|nr:TetR family transcriptional regulator [Ktedonobacteraceae bacterium]
MATTPKGIDRRVQRTQQLLKQAFVEVVREKGFAAMSIQDVTERANVNRGTFYAHFTDKYALLETIIREGLQRILADTLPPVSQWERDTLHLLIRTVLEYFDGKYGPCRPSAGSMVPLFERAAHEVLFELLLEWLRQEGVSRPRVPLTTIAHILSWSVLGAAVQWCQATMEISLDQMAQDVWLVMMEGVEPDLRKG